MMAEQTHDYSRGAWGHDCFVMHVIDGGARLRAGGWGSGVSAGDYLILSNRCQGETTRYLVSAIRYEIDPPDQWFADLEFAPR